MKIDNDIIHKQLLGFQKELSKRNRNGYECRCSPDKYLYINNKTIDLLGSNLHGISVKHENRTIAFCFGPLLENRYLPFARIEKHLFCFDTQKLNKAGQWDILEYQSKYLVTLTIGSFLLNKVWAWLEKGRAIWENECDKNFS